MARAKLEIPQLNRASCPPCHVATGSASQRRHIPTSASPAPVASHTWTSFRRWTLASASFSFVLRQIVAGGRTAFFMYFSQWFSRRFLREDVLQRSAALPFFFFMSLTKVRHCSNFVLRSHFCILVRQGFIVDRQACFND